MFNVKLQGSRLLTDKNKSDHISRKALKCGTCKGEVMYVIKMEKGIIFSSTALSTTASFIFHCWFYFHK
jgi:hypothetical protein